MPAEGNWLLCKRGFVKRRRPAPSPASETAQSRQSNWSSPDAAAWRPCGRTSRTAPIGAGACPATAPKLVAIRSVDGNCTPKMDGKLRRRSRLPCEKVTFDRLLEHGGAARRKAQPEPRSPLRGLRRTHRFAALKLRPSAWSLLLARP